MLPDQENMGIAVWSSLLYHVYELAYTTLYMYFRLMAAMFDLPVTPTSESIRISRIVLLSPENVGVAAEIPLPAAIQDLQSELPS